ncbi:hypothetical protein [Geomicrobium sp. JCM 19039]|uniref:hypothetical protein n=1 Tax=Geomicrobium sp. JCM 19039 TaxID=1460636 RepID=UPI00045F3858|nr:hypothetical protein [Geomicrobium sp. JCM 19039]GAK13210.1 hypothetical protein JCM19039_3039 [Geomicrobium sp. JCM 19039]
METITRTDRLHVRKMTTDDHLSLARIFEDTDSMHYYAGKTPDACLGWIGHLRITENTTSGCGSSSTEMTGAFSVNAALCPTELMVK